MKRFFNRIYSIYGFGVFAFLFIILLPFFLFFILIDDKHPMLFKLNRLWALLFFGLIFIPIEVVYEEPIFKKGQYIFCANHFSYLDIPILGYLNFNAAFIGKSSLAKIPIFGFMFRKIHIAVDRERLRGRSEALKKALDVLGKGTSLIFFPEGGIVSKNPPAMGRFKDGAFRAAVEKQIPVVPVTIPFNWIILPDDKQFLLNWRKAKIIVHKPIKTETTDSKAVEYVKEKTYEVINNELKKYFPEEEFKKVTEKNES